jgi:autotransporter-associated beta strand protein
VLLALALIGPAQAADYYVATNGNDSTGTGSIGSPYATLTKAVGVVSAGDTIYMRGGTYNPTAKISLSKIGTAANPYRIRAYSGEHPSMNCSAVGSGTDGFGLTGAYWQLYGLEIYGAPHNAIRVQGGSTAGAGSHNTIEFCSFHDCGNTGFSIGASQTPTTYLAGSNLVLNCDAYRNFDPPAGGNADGFAVKYYVGPGNTFRGCRSWENSDDGWDLFGAIGRVLIDTCWTWRNGSNVWGAAYNSTFNGNGNGFKLGGDYVAAAHRLVRGVAYQNVGNGGKGIDQNNNTGSLTIDNSTSWGNRAADINMNTTPTTSGVITVRNNLVISGTTNIQSSATQISNSWQVITSPAAGTNDVLSMDASFLAAPRQADGSLPLTPLVRPVPKGRLVDKGANIGEPFYGSAPDLGAYETVVLTWRGDGVSNVWNSVVTNNWFDGQRLMVFTNTAYVTFDDTGSNSPSINLVGTLSPFSVAVTSTRNYMFGGTGSLGGWMMSLVKSGTGQLTLTTSNTFGGGTTVSNGTLLVNNTAGSGTGTGAVTVVSGATLGGSGTIGGPVTVNGTLVPGNGIGTLTISNTLAVTSGAVLQYALGTSSDLTAVSSNLTLGGTLNITDAGGFTSTTYRLFNYGGTLTYNGLTVGTKPNMNFIYTVSTSTVGQVNLIVSNATVSPVASFTASPTNGAAPLVVNFTDNSTGSITSSAWNFGDGGTTNFTAPTSLTYTYGSPGIYTVTLIATGPGGSSSNTQAGLITALAPFAAWQLQYFGCTNNGSLCAQAAPDADPYGKGISNTNQFLLGLNPTDPASVFRILSVVPQPNGDMMITWATGAGPTNVVEATTGDGSGGYSTNFTDISGPLAIPGSGEVTNSYPDQGGTTNNPSRYYRIRLGP